MELKVFGGPSSELFARAICKCLNEEMSLSSIDWTYFSDSERCPQLEENIRGRDVFLVQSTHQPDENWVNLFLMIDAAKRASAKRITAVISYYGYGRQDRKTKSRVPISAKLFADLITTAGANRVLTMDLHSNQLQGYFNIPVDHLYARPILLERLREFYGVSSTDSSNISKDLVIIAPDRGAAELARSYAKRFGVRAIAIADKWRPEPNKSVVDILTRYEIKGKKTLILDDMIDTFGTMHDTSKKLKEMGALEVSAVCTHPVLSGEAIELIRKSPIKKVFVTDTIVLDPKKQIDKIEVVSVAPLFAEAIRMINEENEEDSISSLFE